MLIVTLLEYHCVSKPKGMMQQIIKQKTELFNKYE